MNLEYNRRERKTVKNTIHESDIVLFDTILDIEEETELAPKRTERYAITLCKSGTAHASLDGIDIEISEGDFLVCHPNQIIQHHSHSNDFDLMGIACAADFAVRNLSLINPNSWDIKYFLEHHPLIHLSEEERNVFESYHSFLRNRVEQADGVFRNRILEGLFTSFFLELARIIQQHNGEVRDILFSSADTIFHRFIELINKDYPRERSVEAYAKRLCITPKYLSAVCKKVSGKTALHVISDYVAKDIRYALMHHDKTIKEISFELNFPNLSFFGKYVKDRFGMSPRELRRQLHTNSQTSEETKG